MVAQFSYEPGIESSERYTSESIRLIYCFIVKDDAARRCDHNSFLWPQRSPPHTQIRLPLKMAMAGRPQQHSSCAFSGAINQAATSVIMGRDLRENHLDGWCILIHH